MSLHLSLRGAASLSSPTLDGEARVGALRASGRQVIDLGAGRLAGVPAAGSALVDLIAAQRADEFGAPITADHVLLTHGSRSALFTALLCLTDPGDEVLLLGPYWPTYAEVIRLAGGEPVVVNATIEAGFRVSVPDVEARRTTRTRVLLLSSPSNPVGVVHDESELRAMAKWALEHDVWVIADEAYRDLVFEPFRFVSMPAAAPEAMDRCVIVNGLSKNPHTPGGDLGWVIGPAELIDATRRVHSHISSPVRAAHQAVVHDRLVDAPTDGAERLAHLARRRDETVRHLAAIEGVRCLVPQGGLYCFPSVAGVLGRRIDDVVIDSSARLAEGILASTGVFVLPGEAFGAPGHLRVSFGSDEERLGEGLHRLAAYLGGAA